jgi:hypothetical protein
MVADPAGGHMINGEIENNNRITCIVHMKEWSAPSHIVRYVRLNISASNIPYY